MRDSSTLVQVGSPGRRRANGFQLVIMTNQAFVLHALPAKGSVVLGRGTEADVRIDDPLVSRRHARIHIGETIEVEDLAGTNGTYVRDRRLAPGGRSPLAPGDTVALGETIVVVQAGQGSAVRGASQSEPGGSDRASSLSRIPKHIVIADEQMRRLYGLAALAARSPINILILGETGAGKELLAETIHACSGRDQGPFLCLNCASLSDALLESELFGYEKGAFTGAVQAKPGLLETASGGTVFLDEVGEIAPAIQARLLRTLETREVRRIGALKDRKIDVRFVSATNRDLSGEVQAGRFRKDLFFRLNGLSLTVPPLRERQGEIVVLAKRFVSIACQSMGLAREPQLTEAALVELGAHAWSGNVRELRNVIERAVILCRRENIRPEHLLLDDTPPPVSSPTRVTQPVAAASPPAMTPVETLAPERATPVAATAASGLGGFKTEVAALEQQRITQALLQFGGNQTRAAKHLGISRRTLLKRLDIYKASRPRKSPA